MKHRYSLLCLMICALLSNAVFAQESKPANPRELVESAELILVGKLGRVVSSGAFYGYQENASALAKLDELTPIPLGIPYVDYELNVDRNLMDDGKAVRSRGTPITYRIIQPLGFLEQMNKASDEGREFVFFLSKTPEKGVYSVKTPLHQLMLNGDRPVSLFAEDTEAAGNKERVSRHQNRESKPSSDQFLNEVIAEISRKHTAH